MFGSVLLWRDMNKEELTKKRNQFDSMYDFLRWLYDDSTVEEFKEAVKEEMK